MSLKKKIDTESKRIYKKTKDQGLVGAFRNGTEFILAMDIPILFNRWLHDHYEYKMMVLHGDHKGEYIWRLKFEQWADSEGMPLQANDTEIFDWWKNNEIGKKTKNS